MKRKLMLAMAATMGVTAFACSRNKNDTLTIPLQPVTRQTIVVQAEATGVVEPINVIEVTNLVLKLMQSDLEPDIRNEATNEIRCQYLSAAKARERLGWRPLFQMEEGLGLTIDWYRAFFGAAA